MVGWKPGEEIRVLPMGEARNDHGVQIGDDVGERLGSFRRMFWERCSDVSRLHIRKDTPVADTFDVVDDPVDHLVAVLAELVWRHGRIVGGVVIDDCVARLGQCCRRR